jgi:drug/metabolite transporter (DMT)-like permease
MEVSCFNFALLIVLLPVVIVLLYYLIFKPERSKKDLFFLLGFLAITVYYIITPDPAVIYALYIEKGDYTTPITIALISTFFLLLAVIYFKRYRE